MEDNYYTYDIYEEKEELIIKTLDKYINDTIIDPYLSKNKIIDMHTHTCYSDGELKPHELISLALEKGISTLAITDHDTIEGIKKINRNDDLIVKTGIEIINGIELSVKVPKGRMHILGYGINLEDINLNKKLLELKDNSLNSVLSIIEVLKKDYNIRFTYDEIKSLFQFEHNLGRPDIAKILINKGYVSSVKEAFSKYLIEAHNKTRSFSKGISYEECIDLITKSGGIPILAHPKSLELTEKELLILLKNMINCGLKGIEVFHSSHTPLEIKKYMEIAQKYDLLVSGGSDYHGSTVKPEIELGTGINNNLNIKKLSLLDELHRKIKNQSEN